MVRNSTRPPLPADIAGDLSGAPRPDLRGPSHGQAIDVDQVRANAMAIGHTFNVPAKPAAPAPAAVEPATETVRWALVLPKYLDDQLRTRAAEDGCTKGYLVLQALADAGYTVAPADLVADRRKRR